LVERGRLAVQPAKSREFEPHGGVKTGGNSWVMVATNRRAVVIASVA